MKRTPQPPEPPPVIESLAQDRAVRVLMSLVDDLTVERDEAGLLRSTLEHVVEALDLQGGVTFLLDAEGELRPAAETRVTDDDRAGCLELARRAVDEDRPVFGSIPGGSWRAATALRVQKRTLGVLALHDARGGSAPPDVSLLEALGKQIGTGLDNVRLYAELRASSTRTEILNRITAAMTSSMDLKTVVPAFAREIGQLERFDRLACGFVNDSGDYIEVVGYPEGSTWGLGNVIPVVGSGPGSVVLNSEVVLQTDLLQKHRFIEDMRLLEEGIRSYLLLPINSRGRSIGIMALGAMQAGLYDESTVARMQPIADSVALALENVRLFQKTRELSITDEVTPLYNFRFFHQILDRELKLVDRYRSVLSLIFLDLDNFKPINDQYGHLRGSRVLREVGFLLRSAVRETDYPSRYGGDEFVIILPQTNREAANALGEKLRAIIEGHTFLQEEGIDSRLGASIGVATYPIDATNKEQLIRISDERMYGDKDKRKSGR